MGDRCPFEKVRSVAERSRVEEIHRRDAEKREGESNEHAVSIENSSTPVLFSAPLR
jgi:hypothetical protein